MTVDFKDVASIDTSTFFYSFQLIVALYLALAIDAFPRDNKRLERLYRIGGHKLILEPHLQPFEVSAAVFRTPKLSSPAAYWGKLVSGKKTSSKVIENYCKDLSRLARQACKEE